MLVFLVCSNISISGENEEKPSINLDSTLVEDYNFRTSDVGRALIIDEHFEGTWVTSNDPDDPIPYKVPVHPTYGEWDVDGLCVTGHGYGHPGLHYISQMANWTGNYNLPYDGDYCAGAWWAGSTPPDTAQDEWLKTPELDLSYVSNLKFFFYGIWWWDSYGDDHVYIKVSTDNETTWTVLADLLQDPEYEQGTGGQGGYGWCWNEYQVVLNLSAYDHEPSVIIAYHLEGDPTMMGANYIDAFVLSGTINQSPFIDFTFEPNNPIAGDIIFFNSTSYDPDGIILNWSWSFGDGQVGAGEQITHQYTENGTYEVTLWIVDNDLNEISISKNVNVGSINVTSIKDGWNIVSLPYNLSLDKTILLFRYNNSNYNWTNATTSQNPTNKPLVNKYLLGWNRFNQIYGFTDVLEPGNGYWLYAFEDCEIRLETIILPPEDPYGTYLEVGWNVVGLPFDQEMGKIFLYVNDTHWNIAVSNGWISDFVFGWDKDTQSYVFSDVFEPGQAYWVYSYIPCTLKRST
jgi:hypothetical protein